MKRTDECRAALDRGPLYLRVIQKPTGRRYSFWWGNDQAFSFNVIRRLLRDKTATRAGGTIRKRDGETWRARTARVRQKERK